MAPTGHKGAPTVGGFAVALLQSAVLQLHSYERRSLKNSLSTAPHSSANTPPIISKR